MKHLRSSSEDLRRLFEQSITVREIAEPLVSFDHSTSVPVVREFLATRDYDVAGVRHDGVISGFVRRGELEGSCIGEHTLRIAPAMCLPDRAPLLDVFEVLRQRGFAFITISGTPWGIVTRGDLQKAPVRMWLFGLVSLAEMQMLRLVRLCFPNEEWKEANGLPPNRLVEAQKLFEKRQAKNSQTDLTDCLQLCDKATLLKKHGRLFELLQWRSKLHAKTFFADIESLRNDLAHAQDIVTHRWPGLVELVVELEAFLKRCESLNTRTLSGPVHP